jgi:hypothetical protein
LKPVVQVMVAFDSGVFGHLSTANVFSRFFAVSSPMKGVIMSATNELTILVKAVPRTIPTARSIYILLSLITIQMEGRAWNNIGNWYREEGKRE